MFGREPSSVDKPISVELSNDKLPDAGVEVLRYTSKLERLPARSRWLSPCVRGARVPAGESKCVLEVLER